MPARRRSFRLRLVPALGVLLGVTALPAGASLAPAPAPLPESVTVTDGRTSPPSVDISQVSLVASSGSFTAQWMWITVPHRFRDGHHLTVWFDIDGDAAPEGRLTVRLRKDRRWPRLLHARQAFRIGGGWTGAGRRVPCGSAYSDLPVGGAFSSDRFLKVTLDLWWCLRTPSPPGDGPRGAWRTAVRLAKDGRSDTAPSGRRWSPPVLGWTGCTTECD